MTDAERLEQIRDKVRQAIASQQEKMARLGNASPYADRDAGYLSALEWSRKVVTSNGPPG